MSTPATATAALDAMRRGALTAAELVDELLARIDARSELGCYVHLDADGASGAARAADEARAHGDDRPLLGLPICVKDMLDVAGMPTTACSRAWSSAPRRDAAVVQALRAAGAIVLGKGHTNEWAFGIDGVNPWRPPCRNPHDLDRLPGGSSSGPAVAVAAGLALGGVGTDTSGSLRIPAALCGIVSVRPTPGRVPLDGVLPLAPSYDIAGPLAATAQDVALLLGAMADPGPPPPPRDLRTVALVSNLAGLAQPEVADRLRAAAAALGADEIALPELDHAAEVHTAVQLYEAARITAARGLPPTDLAPDVAERIGRGAAVTDAAYTAARARRAAIAHAVLTALERYDVLLAPASAILAPPRDLPDVRAALLSCVVPFSQVPVPVVTTPLPGPGLPVGAQLVGRPGDDAALLAFSERVRRP